MAVVGSRLWNNYEKLRRCLDRLILSEDIKIKMIVSGGAQGTDSLAKRYAAERKYPFKSFPVTDEAKQRLGGFGPAAKARNQRIVQEADLVVGFIFGESKGTKMTLKFAEEADVDTIEYHPKE